MIKSLVPTALLAVALVPGTAAAQPQPISSCNYHITAPGDYVLAQDLICNQGPGNVIYGIVIDANDVVLRLDGHTIQTATIGIVASERSDVTIKGPGAVVDCLTGVSFVSTVQSRVTGLTVIGSTGTGILVSVGSDNVLTANTVRESRIGIQIRGSFNNVVQANQAIDNELVGIFVRDISPYYSYGNVFRANVAKGSNPTFYDIRDESTGCVNTWVKNFFGTTNSVCVQ